MRFLVLSFLLCCGVTLSAQPSLSDWKHIGTHTLDLDVPNAGNQQTALLVADLDKDGVNDFVVTERTRAPSVVWYRKRKNGWDRYIIDGSPLPVEAGSASADIDNDGDIDIVFGGDHESNEVWWWENPYPAFDNTRHWNRFNIKKSGDAKHHDQMFGDFDHDGKEELVFWNQGGAKLIMAEIPTRLKSVDEWKLTTIYEWSTDGQMLQRGEYPSWKGINEHEGLAKADIDGDGTMDIVGAGRWFKYSGEEKFKVNLIDAGYAFTRSLTGQFVEGGRPEVILVAGDGTAPMVMYEWKKGTWGPTVLIERVIDGHSLCVVDFNRDGYPDIFTAEMGLGNSPNPKTRVLLGDGAGNFIVKEILSGFGFHESLLIDLDGDNDPDLLGKPYAWKAPRLDIWLNPSR